MSAGANKTFASADFYAKRKAMTLGEAIAHWGNLGNSFGKHFWGVPWITIPRRKMFFHICAPGWTDVPLFGRQGRMIDSER